MVGSGRVSPVCSDSGIGTGTSSVFDEPHPLRSATAMSSERIFIIRKELRIMTRNSSLVISCNRLLETFFLPFFCHPRERGDPGKNKDDCFIQGDWIPFLPAGRPVFAGMTRN